MTHWQQSLAVAFDTINKDIATTQAELNRLLTVRDTLRTLIPPGTSSNPVIIATTQKQRPALVKVKESRKSRRPPKMTQPMNPTRTLLLRALEEAPHPLTVKELVDTAKNMGWATKSIDNANSIVAEHMRTLMAWGFVRRTSQDRPHRFALKG